MTIQATMTSPQAGGNRSIPYLLILVCFLSGAASLFYQILWTRAFSLILGTTVEAAALVFAAFISGLAVGAWLFGRWSSQMYSPVKIYALLELGIALFAVGTGLVLHHQADHIGGLLGESSIHLVPAFLLSMVMVLLPAILMGGTLPILFTVAKREEATLSVVGRLYGWNIFGAAMGTLACGFFSIRLLGVTQSYYCAMGLNLLAALISVLWLRSLDHKVVSRHDNIEQRAAESVGKSSTSLLSERYLLLLAFASGVVVLALEVVWARFASFFLGNRTYAFSLLLFSVLTMLAVGSWVSARIFRRALYQKIDPYRPFAWLLVLSALAIALSTITGTALIAYQQSIEASLPMVEDYLLLYRAIEAFLLVGLPLLLLGALFPLTMASSRECERQIGRTTARFYVVNAAGVVLGSVGAAFIGIEWLGSYGLFKLMIVLLVGLTLYTLYLSRKPTFGLLSTALVSLFLLIWIPGSYPPVLYGGEKLLLEREDKHGLFRLIETPNGNLRVTNNQVELVYHLGVYSTDYVQQMQGHLGLLFNPNAKSALIIGSGYGITAGALAAHNSIEQVDAVEILPVMVEEADRFAPNHFDYHQNAKVNIYVDDGRHFLARQNRRYDIITANVSDPHLPGGASLFHTDFYELVKARLNPGGVFIQHVFGSERAVIANTMVSAFADTRFSISYANGYNVVASNEALEASWEKFALPEESEQQLLSHNLTIVPLPPVQHYEDLPPSMKSDVIASDDFPAVEFSWNEGEKLLFINE